MIPEQPGTSGCICWAAEWERRESLVQNPIKAIPTPRRGSLHVNPVRYVGGEPVATEAWGCSGERASRRESEGEKVQG